MNSSTLPSPINVAPRWAVVITHAHREREAKYHLERQSFQVYLPMCLGHPKSKNPIQPFFPRHVFVQLDTRQDRWSPILSTIGVQSVLFSGDKPGTFGDAEMRRIREMEVDGLIKLREAVELPCPFKAGDKVRVADLPAAALFVRELGATRRVELMISLFGREWVFERPLSHVSAAA